MSRRIWSKTASALTKISHDELHRLAEGGEIIAYFGYGSLVNTNTLRTQIVHHERAQLSGFARTWQARPDEADLPIALLSSAVSSPADVLDGLLVFDRLDHLPALDKREAGYDRIALTTNQVTLFDDMALPDCPLYVYSGRAPHRPDEPHYILQSYLDAVLQGYLHQYGFDGARNFVERTAAFNTPLLEDRSKPHYPRSVILSDVERIHIDSLTEFMSRVDQF